MNRVMHYTDQYNNEYDLCSDCFESFNIDGTELVEDGSAHGPCEICGDMSDGE